MLDIFTGFTVRPVTEKPFILIGALALIQEQYAQRRTTGGIGIEIRNHMRVNLDLLIGGVCTPHV